MKTAILYSVPCPCKCGSTLLSNTFIAGQCCDTCSSRYQLIHIQKASTIVVTCSVSEQQGEHLYRHPSYQELHASCKKLSAATQVVDNLKKDLVEEQQRRGAADRAVERASARLADLKHALASCSGSEAIASLKQQAAKLRDLVNTALPTYASLIMHAP